MDKSEIDIFEEIARDYPGLRLVSRDNSFAIYKGLVGFKADYEGRGLVEDDFEVEIVYPIGFGHDLPTAKEIGGRIPRKPDFHINPDGTMCLGTPHAVRQKWNREPSLNGFINLLVIPFLYFYSFQKKYGRNPFDDLAHGGEGLLAYYKELLVLNSDLSVLEYLKIIIEDNYRGHIPCPCKSGTRLRDCHGPKIKHIRNQQTRSQYWNDFLSCLRFYTDGGNKLPGHFFTKRFRGCCHAMLQTPNSQKPIF